MKFLGSKSAVVLEFSFHYMWEYIQLPLFLIFFIETPRFSMAAIAAFSDALALTTIYYLTTTYVMGGRFKIASLVLAMSAFFVIVAEIVGTRFGLWGYSEELMIIPMLDVAVLPVMQYVCITLLMLMTRGYSQKLT